MTNPVHELIRNLETSWEHGTYNTIIFNIGNGEIHTTIDDITYVSRYFFKIRSLDGDLYFVNINNLVGVKLVC